MNDLDVLALELGIIAECLLEMGNEKALEEICFTLDHQKNWKIETMGEGWAVIQHSAKNIEKITARHLSPKH